MEKELMDWKRTAEKLREHIRENRLSKPLSNALKVEEDEVEEFVRGDREYDPEILSAIGVILGLATKDSDVFILTEEGEDIAGELRRWKK